MKLNKKQAGKIKIYSIIIALFLTSTAFLLGIPKVIKVAQSQVVVSNSDLILYSQNLPPEPSRIAKEQEVFIVDKGITLPTFSAEAILVIDLDLDDMLYQKNIHKRMSPASTTKLMTALVALDYYKPEDVLVVTEESLVGGSTMGLSLGERLTFRSLLYGMLLNSGNDAAYTIAANFPGGVDMFVSQMNKKIEELGLSNSHFENPAGFDGPNHYSSAYDLSKIAQLAQNNPQLSKVVSTKQTSVTSIDSTKAHPLRNLNKLLGEEGVLGVKTGYTEKSGENLVGLVNKNDHRILTVVLNSEDRFGETKLLIDWVYTNFDWRRS